MREVSAEAIGKQEISDESVFSSLINSLQNEKNDKVKLKTAEAISNLAVKNKETLRKHETQINEILKSEKNEKVISSLQKTVNQLAQI